MLCNKQTYGTHHLHLTRVTLPTLLLQGVPHELRGWVWWHVSGAGSWKQNAGEGYFARMLEQGRSSNAVKQIELVSADAKRRWLLHVHMQPHPMMGAPPGTCCSAAAITLTAHVLCAILLMLAVPTPAELPPASLCALLPPRTCRALFRATPGSTPPRARRRCARC